MEQTSFLDFLGINPEDSLKKKEEKKDAKSSKNTKSSKKEMYNLPITVFCGYRKAFLIESTEKKIMDRKELTDAIAREMQVKPEILNIEFSNDRKNVYVGIHDAKKIVKGEITVKKGCRLILPDGKSIPSKEDGKIEITGLAKMLAESESEAFRNGIGVVKESDDFYIVFSGKVLEKELSFPVQINVYGRESFLISQDEWESFLSEKKENNVTCSKEMLKNYILNKFPEFTEHIEIFYQKNEEHEVPQVTVAFVVKEQNFSGKKKNVMFPTNATLYALAGTIALESTMFHDKNEVTEDEIIKFASEHISPILKKGRCHAKYYKADNCIYISMEGSSKGAIPVIENSSELLREKEKTYTMFRYIPEEVSDKEFLVEKNPAMCCTYDVKKENGNCKLLCGKLPISLYEKIKAFFSAVAREFHTEVMVRVFFNVESKNFEIFLPYQDVGDSFVTETGNPYFGEQSKYIVAEFHSHCHYDAFFSFVDNADEQMAILYGVFGGYGSKDVQFMVRSCCCGNHFRIPVDEIFDARMIESPEEIDQFVVSLMEQAKEKLHIK